MKSPPKSPPRRSEAGHAEHAARLARRAEALRENLKKRKAQALARTDTPPHPPDALSTDSPADSDKK